MPLIIPSNSISGEFEVANSLRFDSGSSDNLTRTPSSSSNRKTFTISFWVKRCKFGSNNYLMATSTGTSEALIVFFNGDKFDVRNLTAGSGGFGLTTNRLFRDPSAWYHIVVAVDTTQATSSDRVKIYVSGTQETSLSVSNYPAQNVDVNFNSTIVHTISGGSGTSNYLNGYLTEYVVIDGQALDPTSFGEFDEDSGIWKPKAISGLTFGTNGFYLDFENSGSLGNDKSGNGNNFTVNNLTSIDQTTDTPTNNYATMNPLEISTNISTFSEGNCKVSNSSANWSNCFSSLGAITGKWYAEFKFESGTYDFVGISELGYASGMGSNPFGDAAVTGSNGYSIFSLNGNYHQSGTTDVAFTSTWTSGDIIGVYMDLDNGKLYFSKNGTLASSTGKNITTGEFYGFAVANYNATSSANFGNPISTISSGNSDPNGYGNFEYSTTITGDGVSKDFYALNTKNLAEYG